MSSPAQGRPDPRGEAAPVLELIGSASSGRCGPESGVCDVAGLEIHQEEEE